MKKSILFNFWIGRLNDVYAKAIKQHLGRTQFFVLLAIFVVATTTGRVSAQSFEAEQASLSRGAVVQNAGECSGGQQVGNLGGTQNGAVTKVFQLSAAGDYDLTVGYSTADTRSFSVWVNYGQRIEVACPPSGGWAIPATVQVQVPLLEGSNTLVFDNPTSWAPNLDFFALQPSPTFNISGKIFDNGSAAAEVSLTLSGAKSATIETDSEGNYMFTGLTAGKNYTVTPSMSERAFSPSYLSFNDLSEEKTEQNFEALPFCETCTESLSFGSGGTLKYNTQTGTYSVFQDDQEIISTASAVVKVGDVEISSMNYTNRSVQTESISDDYGNGQKMTITLTSDNLPEMEQVFYGYADHDYFLMEVIVRGEQVSSNYMAPLVTNSADIEVLGDNRFLAVPFDNDGFIRYKSNSLESYQLTTSSEVSAFYDNTSRKGLVCGSVEHEVWKTGVKGAGQGKHLSSLVVWGGYTDEQVTRDSKEHGEISGASIKSPKIFVGYFDDWRLGMEAFGKANTLGEPRYVFEWDKPTPFGWNSWGAIQTNLSLEKAKAVVDFFSQDLPEFRNDNTAYIDLDSFWDNMVDGGWEGDYSKLVTFANYCKSKGLKPGIYWGPFVDWGKYNRTVEGSVYSYAATWLRVNGNYHDEDGGRAMDPTHPATKDRIKYIINKLVECGFEMIKIDFIGHASAEADSYFDPEVTTGMQAFRQGMEYLIDQLDGKMLIYAAISPNLATARYVHSRRIACDAYSDIGATEYTLNSNTYGWWQDQMYDFIDGDHLVLGNSSLGENHARLASGLINGTLINGDDFSTTGQWTERAKALLNNKEILDVARDGVAFRPVEGNSENGASEVFTKKDDRGYVVIVVNYGSAKTFQLEFSRLGIESANYEVKELFSGDQITYEGESVELDVAARDAVVLRLSKGFPDWVENHTENSSIQIFPNPVQQKLYIKGDQRIEEINIYSSLGKLMKSISNLDSTEVGINLNGIPEGVLMIEVTDKLGVKSTQKIIKSSK